MANKNSGETVLRWSTFMQKASDLNIAKVEDSALPKPTYKLVHLYPSCCEHWITIPDATFSCPPASKTSSRGNGGTKSWPSWITLAGELCGISWGPFLFPCLPGQSCCLHSPFPEGTPLIKSLEQESLFQALFLENLTQDSLWLNWIGEIDENDIGYFQPPCSTSILPFFWCAILYKAWNTKNDITQAFLQTQLWMQIRFCQLKVFNKMWKTELKEKLYFYPLWAVFLLVSKALECEDILQ